MSVWSCCGTQHPGPHLSICPHQSGRGLSDRRHELWECECPTGYIHSGTELRCDGCGKGNPNREAERVSSHGEWDKAQQRYEDGCKSGAPEHVEGRGLSGNSTTHDTDWCFCPKATQRHFVTDRCLPRVQESVMDNAACTCPILPVQHRATVYCQETPDA